MKLVHSVSLVHAIFLLRQTKNRTEMSVMENSVDDPINPSKVNKVTINMNNINNDSFEYLCVLLCYKMVVK